MKASIFLLTVALVACGEGKSAPPPPPCDQSCQDESAVRALRETLKLAFNLTLQGKPVGPQDERIDCPLGGNVHVFGTAASNATQGTTEVDLTYELASCAYLLKDDEPKNNYTMTLNGTMTQKGTIAVQPSATTALVMESAAMSFDGNVYLPPIGYTNTCAVRLGQSGNRLTGTVCERTVGVDL